MPNQYTIKRGDWLSKIAITYKTTVAELLKLNPEIKDANKIYVGQVINVPGPAETPGNSNIKTDIPIKDPIVIPPTTVTPYIPPLGEKIYNPSVTVTGPAGGVAVNVTTLDKLLAAMTSSFAIFKNRAYVPTTVQPVQGGLTPIVGGGAGGGNQLIDPRTGRVYSPTPENTGSAIQNFIEQNTGFLLLLGIGVVLLLAPRPKVSFKED